MTGADDEFDVVVVGAGSSGATLARASHRPPAPGRAVDAGPDVGADGWPARLLDADRLPAAEDPWVLRTPVPAGPGRTLDLLSGRVVGGSTAVNGAYFVRPTRVDLDGSASRGNDLWAHDACCHAVPAGVRRRVRRRGSRPRGPGPGHPRSRPTHPVTEAFFATYAAASHVARPDLNDGGGVGWGLVPRNIDRHGRVGGHGAGLPGPARDRPRLVLHAGHEVRRVVTRRPRRRGGGAVR